MRMFIHVSFLHVAMAESESAQQNSIRLGNGHVVKFFNGISFAFLLEIFDGFINKLISFLDVN